MSLYLTKETAELAMDVIMVAIEVSRGQLKLRPATNPVNIHGYMAVLNPTVQRGSVDLDLPRAILADRKFGEEEEWEYPYREIACGKLALSWKHGESSWYIQENKAHLLEIGDVVWGGSAVYEGIITVYSGAQSWMDAMIAMQLAVTCWGFAQNNRQRIMALLPKLGLDLNFHMSLDGLYRLCFEEGVSWPLHFVPKPGIPSGGEY